jgi:hypothetical protein
MGNAPGGAAGGGMGGTNPFGMPPAKKEEKVRHIIHVGSFLIAMLYYFNDNRRVKKRRNGNHQSQVVLVRNDEREKVHKQHSNFQLVSRPLYFIPSSHQSTLLLLLTLLL